MEQLPISITMLGRNPSKWVNQAEEGEEVGITKRGKLAAKLVPPTYLASPQEAEEELSPEEKIFLEDLRLAREKYPDHLKVLARLLIEMDSEEAELFLAFSKQFARAVGSASIPQPAPVSPATDEKEEREEVPRLQLVSSQDVQRLAFPKPGHTSSSWNQKVGCPCGQMGASHNREEVTFYNEYGVETGSWRGKVGDKRALSCSDCNLQATLFRRASGYNVVYTHLQPDCAEG